MLAILSLVIILALGVNGYFALIHSEESISARSVYTGAGNNIFSVIKPDGTEQPSLTYMNSGDESGPFRVIGYDETGDQLRTFIDTSGPYEGLLLLDGPDPTSDVLPTARLSIEATGQWTIELRSVAEARIYSAPGTISGKGDEVIQIQHYSDTAEFMRPSETEIPFQVRSFGPRAPIVIVETSGYFHELVEIPPQTVYLEIRTPGDWSIKTTTEDFDLGL